MYILVLRLAIHLISFVIQMIETLTCVRPNSSLKITNKPIFEFQLTRNFWWINRSRVSYSSLTYAEKVWFPRSACLCDLLTHISDLLFLDSYFIDSSHSFSRFYWLFIVFCTCFFYGNDFFLLLWIFQSRKIFEDELKNVDII